MAQQKRQFWIGFGIMIGITCFYAFITLQDLGYSYAPSTGWQGDGEGSEILLDFGREVSFEGISCYLGNYERRKFVLEMGNGDPVCWGIKKEICFNRVYQWEKIKAEGTGRYLRLTALNQIAELKELVIHGADQEILVPANASLYPELFDEGYMLPDYPTFRAGTIFDESYFGRTAYEYLHGIRSYEDTHPPLGKLLISVGIALFGMNPWGWRIVNAVSGIVVLPLIWDFARRVLEEPWGACAATGLLALDFMHFTQTRVAGVDGFLVLFIWSAYYFIYRYWEKLGKKNGSGWLFLLAAGICLGIAIGCKWSGFYGAAGAAVLLLSIFWGGYRSGSLSARYLRRTFWVCVGVFVAVPAGIYLASYLVYVPVGGKTGLLQDMWANQKNMLLYHANQGTEHVYASKWYQWPLTVRPVLYFKNSREGMTEAVFTMGNPVVWWSGALCFFWCLYRALERDKKAAFLCVTYLAPFLPWILVPRYSFLYHYFPCVLPSVLCTVYCCGTAVGKNRGRFYMGGLLLTAGTVFVLYYPILAGQLVRDRYIEWLDWLPGWGLL